MHARFYFTSQKDRSCLWFEKLQADVKRSVKGDGVCDLMEDDICEEDNSLGGTKWTTSMNNDDVPNESRCEISSSIANTSINYNPSQSPPNSTQTSTSPTRNDEWRQCLYFLLVES